MNNRIRRVEVRNHLLTPTEAESWITVHAETIGDTMEIRGRLMGPSCSYSNTIEVAYPLRPLLRRPAETAPLTMRVVIPEPSFWEPESPFLYQGPVELWQDGQRCDRLTVQHGLCTSLLSPRGLRWNGKLLLLRGRRVSQLTEAAALSLRRAGCNLLLAPIEEPDTWEIADRLGFLILGQLSQMNAATRTLAEKLSPRPSCLGWLVPAACAKEAGENWPGRVGVEVTDSAAIPSWAAFGLCTNNEAKQFAGSRLPLLLEGDGGSLASPVIGYIQ